MEYFRTAKKLNRRQAHWSLFLSKFDFTLHHRPGCTMGKPDALSCRANHGTGADDNLDIVLLKPEVFSIVAITSALDLIGEEVEILKDVHFAICQHELEEPVMHAVQELQKSHTHSI